MATRVLQNTTWIDEYMRYNEHSEAPDVLHKWTGVYIVSCALRRKCYIDMKSFKWFPNFYIIFVAPPGIATKSTTILIGEEFVAKIPKLTIGPNSMTWQVLPKAMQDSLDIFTMPDGTIMTMCPVAFFASELQSLITLDDKEMLSLLTDLWDGKEGKWTRATKTSGSNTITNPFLNIIACTTPANIEDIPARTLRGGFASRTIWVSVNEKKRLVPYPAFVKHPASQLQRRNGLEHDLALIGQLAGEYTLEPSAITYGEKWYENLYMKEYPDSTDEETKGRLARKQTQLHKLGMVLSASRSDVMTITETDLRTADAMLREIDKGAIKVFQIVTTANGQATTVQIHEVIMKYKKLTRQELYKKFYTQISKPEFDEALSSLHQAGFIVETASALGSFIEAVP